jgi:hypothetical protein
MKKPPKGGFGVPRRYKTRPLLGWPNRHRAVRLINFSFNKAHPVRFIGFNSSFNVRQSVVAFVKDQLLFTRRIGSSNLALAKDDALIQTTFFANQFVIGELISTSLFLNGLNTLRISNDLAVTVSMKV